MVCSADQGLGSPAWGYVFRVSVDVHVTLFLVTHLGYDGSASGSIPATTAESNGTSSTAATAANPPMRMFRRVWAGES
jgi:hypothetical protein